MTTKGIQIYAGFYNNTLWLLAYMYLCWSNCAESFRYLIEWVNSEPGRGLWLPFYWERIWARGFAQVVERDSGQFFGAARHWRGYPLGPAHHRGTMTGLTLFLMPSLRLPEDSLKSTAVFAAKSVLLTVHFVVLPWKFVWNILPWEKKKKKQIM